MSDFKSVIKERVVRKGSDGLMRDENNKFVYTGLSPLHEDDDVEDASDQD